MAVSRILGVLSLVGALFLLSNALPRLRGPLADALDGARLLDLATRRNMVLLCHAILLVLLGDAGILGVPAARRRRRHRQSQSAAEEATTTAVAVAKEKQQQQTHSSYLHRQAAAAAELIDHPAAAAMELGRALVLADPQQKDDDDAPQGQAAAEQFAQEEEEEEEDAEEMNRRFEAFIAATKEKMRLEALHPHPAPSLAHNTQLLAR